MLDRTDIRGIIAFLPTAFSDGGGIDMEANRANVRTLVEQGTPIIQGTGGAAEFYSLTLAEHKSLMHLIAAEAGSSALTMCGCGTVASTADAIARVRCARDAGIDSAMLLPPHYFATRPKEVIGFFEDVAAAVPDMPLLHFNTRRAKVWLQAEHYRELAQIPSFVGVKLPGDSLYEWFSISAQAPELAFIATDDLWVPAVMNGCPAIDSILAATRPAFARALWVACEQQDWTAAMALQRQAWRLSAVTNRLPAAEAAYGDCSVDKGVVQAAGVLQVGAPRPPYRPVDRDRIGFWQERFREFDQGRYADAGS